MNKRYIDIDSYYRDRKLYPNPGEFKVQMSQSGIPTDANHSKNAIALSYPYYQWQWGCVQVAGGSAAGTTPSGIGLALGGTGPTFAGIVNNTQIQSTNTLGTPLQPQPADLIRAGTVPPPNIFISRNYTKNNNFFNGLEYQNAVQVGGRPNSARIVAYESGPTVLGTGPTSAANPFGILNGKFTLESALSVLNTGDDMRLENNYLAGPPATIGTAPFPPAQVFIPGGVGADGVYVGDFYESLLTLGGLPVCSQFRRIVAYNGTTRVATLESGISGWTSAANDTAIVPGGATYLHRLRRELPLFPLDIGFLTNIPLTPGGNQPNAAYEVTLINPGTGLPPYGITIAAGSQAIDAVSGFRIDILTVSATGQILSFVISNPGTGLAIGQILTLTQASTGANTATVRVDNVGFGVNVLNAGSALGPPSQLTAIATERNRFNGQIFYIPALNQNGAAVGTLITDPSAAQQFIPQSNTRVSLTGAPYSNDSTASSIIYADIIDTFGAGTRFLVIQPFQQAFPGPGFEFNILQFTNDHVVPYNYTGTQVSQSQSVCYQLTLEAITLPNQSISALGLGGKIAFYPYLYVEFANASTACGQANTSALYSNNPAADSVLFKVSITDTPTPFTSRFIKLRGDGVQTMKFKPNDSLKIRIVLPNGTTFETITKDFAPPLLPSLLSQISLTIGIERL